MASLDQFPQPEWSDSSSVEAALDLLRKAHDPSTADEACDAFLWSLGNNHAGTFYPVVLAVLPELERILVSGKTWSQCAAMESLIDLGGSFVSADGYETYLGASVQETLKAFIHSMRPHIVLLASEGDARGKSAIDLLELIDDQTIDGQAV